MHNIANERKNTKYIYNFQSTISRMFLFCMLLSLLSLTDIHMLSSCSDVFARYQLWLNCDCHWKALRLPISDARRQTESLADTLLLGSFEYFQFGHLQCTTTTARTKSFGQFQLVAFETHFIMYEHNHFYASSICLEKSFLYSFMFRLILFVLDSGNSWHYSCRNWPYRPRRAYAISRTTLLA